MLWLGRSLFIVCLGLFTVAVLNAAANGVDILTVSLGAMSLGGVLLAVLRDVPEALTRHLANVVQIQTIVTGCDRQISVLESQAFGAMNRKELDNATVSTTVLNTQEHLDAVVARAVARIQDFVEQNGNEEPEEERPNRAKRRARRRLGRGPRRPRRSATRTRQDVRAGR